MKNTIRASIILGSGTFVSLLVGVIKKKLFAVYLGPYGLGIYVQVFNYFNIATMIATFGLSQAITTYIAKNKNATMGNEEIGEILKIAFSILLFLSFIFFLMSVIFAKTISQLIIGESSLYYLVVICAIGIPFQVLGQGFLSYLQAIKDTPKISFVNISISVIGLIWTVIVVSYYGILGSIISIPFFALMTFVFFLIVSLKRIQLNFLKGIFNFTAAVKSPLFLKLIDFGSLWFAQSVIAMLTIFIMRIIIVRKLGMSYNGYYEAVYTFSQLILPFISNILWSYSYSEYCNAINNKALSEVINKFLKLSITIAFPITIFLILFRFVLIEKIIFTSEFSHAVQLLPARLLVDFLTIIMTAFNVALLAKDRLKVLVGFEIIKDIFLLIFIAYTISSYKLGGVLAAEILSALFMGLMAYIYIKKHFAFNLSENNRNLLISALFIICVISFFPEKNIFFVLLGVFVSTLWIFLFAPFIEIKEAVKSFRLSKSAISIKKLRNAWSLKQ